MRERDLFIEALQHDDPGQRAAHLEAACAGNPEDRTVQAAAADR
jgi:hypothetical protein